MKASALRCVKMALAAVIGTWLTAGAGADTITGVNCGAFSWYDINRFGLQNLVGQHTSEGSWFDNAPPAHMKWLVLNLNALYTLDNMKVLNYARLSDGPNRQMKTAPIEYSLDGLSWTTLEASHTFKLFNDGWDTINFGGIQARLVRIGTPTTGYTNQGGGELRTGLSEVTFEGTPIAESFSEITGITATASSSYSGYPPSKTVDGSGLMGDEDGDGIQQHRTSRGGGGLGDIYDAWRCLVSGSWIQWDFGTPRNLQNMLVWNNNGRTENFNSSIGSARIRYSLDGSEWTVLGTGLFLPAWNADQMGISFQRYDEAFTQFNFGGVKARYVMFDELVNLNGGVTDFALSEVKFYEGAASASKGTVVMVR